MNHTCRILALAMLAVALTGCQTVTTRKPQPEEVRVLAHYMPWFRAEPQSDGTIRWEHWQWFGKGKKHDPDEWREEGRRDIASVYYPLIGPYHGADDAVLEYHILTAAAAGLEAFVADWYGPGTYTDVVFSNLLRVAERLDFKVAICLEEKSFFPSYSQATNRSEVLDVMDAQLRHVLARHVPSSAYLRIHNQPALFIFNNWGEGALGIQMLTPEELASVLGRFRATPFFYVRGDVDSGYFPMTAGAYAWCGPKKYRDVFYQSAKAARESGQLQWIVGPAHPGFDDTGVWGWGQGPRVTARDGDALYREYWDAVLDNRPDAVQVVTWNDFEEGTSIEPSREYGYTFVDLTEEYAGRFTGRAVMLDDNRLPYRLYQLRRAVAALDDSSGQPIWKARLDALAGRLRAVDAEAAEELAACERELKIRGE